MSEITASINAYKAALQTPQIQDDRTALKQIKAQTANFLKPQNKQELDQFLKYCELKAAHIPFLPSEILTITHLERKDISVTARNLALAYIQNPEKQFQEILNYYASKSFERLTNHQITAGADSAFEKNMANEIDLFTSLGVEEIYFLTIDSHLALILLSNQIVYNLTQRHPVDAIVYATRLSADIEEALKLDPNNQELLKAQFLIDAWLTHRVGNQAEYQALKIFPNLYHQDRNAAILAGKYLIAKNSASKLDDQYYHEKILEHWIKTKGITREEAQILFQKEIENILTPQGQLI